MVRYNKRGFPIDCDDIMGSEENANAFFNKKSEPIDPEREVHFSDDKQKTDQARALAYLATIRPNTF